MTMDPDYCRFIRSPEAVVYCASRRVDAHCHVFQRADPFLVTPNENTLRDAPKEKLFELRDSSGFLET